ncbi:MAG: CBS domain-containing protein, partial [Candidatus Caldarchaeum sp.]
MWQTAKVRDVVKSPIISIEEDSSVVEAAKVMAEKKISGIVITNKGKPVGLVTERDVVSKVVAAGKDPSQTTVKEVMSKPLITIDIEATLLEAVDLMNRKKVRRLLVTRDDEIIGLFTIRDVLALSRICA